MKAVVYTDRSHQLPLDEAPSGYQHFDARDDGWTKVVLHP
jgi:glutathione-independent formaldehyde dehydrogenase